MEKYKKIMNRLSAFKEPNLSSEAGRAAIIGVVVDGLIGLDVDLTKYEHHGELVLVNEPLKGRHRDLCLCHKKCVHFKPGQEDNCKIAAAVYKNCVDFGITTPMWECPKFSKW